MKKTAILGFGNPVRSDDGVGCLVIETLKEELGDRLPDISLLDMGTSAFEVLFQLQGHERIILVDGVLNTGEPDGTLYRLPAEAVAAAVQDDPMVFLHGLKWDQALSYAKKILRNDYPDDISVYLISITNIRLEVGLSAVVEQAARSVTNLILEELGVKVFGVWCLVLVYKHTKNETRKTKNEIPNTSMSIKLKTQHLWIAGALAADAFGDAAQVYVVYYPQRQALLLAPMDDEIFPTIHKGGLQMLKNRNLQGDKTISLQEIIIDHDIDDTDRDLVFMHQPGMRMLHVTL